MRTIQVLILLIFCYSAFSQGEIDDQQKIFYRNERTVGLLLKSNGFGIDYQYGKWTNAFNKTIWEVGISNINHPKEYKVKLTTSSKPLKYGKINNLFVVRGGYGLQRRMFKKIDKGGISIRSVYSFGPSLGLLKPIYYIYEEIREIDGQYYTIPVSILFDNTSHNLIGPTSKDAFTKGIGETKLLPGAYIKYCINFEYSTVDELVHALELGVSLDAFLFEAPIMADLAANHFFFTMFITYRFGKIINPQLNF